MLLIYSINRYRYYLCYSKLIVLFCFAKKVPKKATRKRLHPVFGKELRLSFCATVVNSSGSLMGSVIGNKLSLIAQHIFINLNQLDQNNLKLFMQGGVQTCIQKSFGTFRYMKCLLQLNFNG